VAARREVTDAAFASGATFFDSSPMYGEAERVLGQSLQGRRAQALVATKVWAADDRAAEQQVTSALRFFGGRVDVYQVHNLVAWPKHVAHLARLQASGSVGVIGLTHYSPAAFGELRRAMEDRRVGAIQVPYNPLERDVENVILPAAADLGLGVIVMRPFGAGELLGRQVSDEELAPLAPFGVTTWAQALLKWILSDSRCHVAIPATTSPAHMRMNAAVILGRSANADRPASAGLSGRAATRLWFGPDERAYVTRLAQR
jgi:aryl-alcohol dehydrogenase-like predicted oxidoreductase